MKPDATAPSPEASTSKGIDRKAGSSRVYYAIFLPLGLIGFASSFYITYERNEPLTMPAGMPSRLRMEPTSSAPPFFEEGPPPSPAPSAAGPAPKRE